MNVIVNSALAASLVTLCVSCGSVTESKPDPKLIVNTATAENQNTASRKEFTFISKPFRSSELSFRVGGPIDKAELYAGNHYRTGEVIAQIDPRDFAIRHERAEAVYSQAKAEFERIEVLFEKNNISASIYEKAKADYTSAKTAFESATNDLKDTKLVAPFDGYVGEVYIEKHQDVKATQKIVSLVDINQLKIEVFVTQDIAFNCQGIKEISLRFDAMPDKTYIAQVEELSKSTSQNNLSYLLTALLPNSDGKLLSGMSGKVSFEVDDKAAGQTVSIPQTALCYRPTIGDYVWVVKPDGQTVEMREISRGPLLPNGKVSISQGIEKGEMVAVSSLRFLSDGAKVEIPQAK